MNTPTFLKSIVFLLCFTSCERTLDFEGISEEENNLLAINAVAMPDSILRIYLTRADRVDKLVVKPYTDFSHAMNLTDNPWNDYRTDEYLTQNVIKDAIVNVEVNGLDTYQMNYNEARKRYECAYIPQENDHIVVSTYFSSAGGKPLRAETTVPVRPHIKVVNREVLAENPYQHQNGLSFVTDTIMRLTCRINDPGGIQYYRLRIRSERERLTAVGATKTWHGFFIKYAMQDIFFSTDDLFNDNRLARNFGGWPAYFSNAFDNKLFSGGEYTFIIDSPKIPYTAWPLNWAGYTIAEDATYDDKMRLPPRVMVELQAITPDYYKFLKSMELYRITTVDAYSEPIHIYSNAENGWGIFGALNYDRHFVEFDE